MTDNPVEGSTGRDSFIAHAKLLGEFQIFTKSNPSLLPRGRKARCIIAQALLSGTGCVARDRLVGTLWSDRGEDQARASLRQAIAEIRRSFGTVGADIIDVDRARVCLDRTLISSDIDGIEQDGPPSSHWPGELLEDLDGIDPEFDEWLRVERARLRNLWLHHLERRLNLAVESNEPDKIDDAAKQLLSFDATNELAARAAIRALAESGNAAAAIRQFDTLEKDLKWLLDARPSAETLDLVAQVKRGEIRSAPVLEGSPLRPQAKVQSRATAPRLAVLPIVNLSGNASENYLCDGISDEFITALSKLGELRVLSRHVSFGFRGLDVDLGTLRSRLGADYALLGSMMRSGDTLRFNLHISDLATGQHVWGERFDHKSGDLLTLIDRVVEPVRAATVPAVEQHEAARIRMISTEVLKAYDLYLRGKHIYYAGESEDYAKRALTHFEQAYELDPDFESVIVQLIRLYNTELTFSTAGANLSAYREKALMLAERLLMLDAKNPSAHIAMAWCLMWKRQFLLADSHFEDALRLAPYDADRLNAIATGLMYLGRLDDALSVLKQSKEAIAFDLDYMRTDFGEIYFLKEDFEAARQYLEFGEQRSFRPALWLAATYGRLGLIDMAERKAEQFVARVERIWVGSPSAGATDYVEWAFRHMPFARPQDEQLLRDGLRSAGLPA